MTVCCLLLATPSHAAETQFFDTLYDVPVMPGMNERPDMAMSFDKPDGRIAEAGAVASDMGAGQIIAFYKESLSQMGWQNQAGNVFVREGEKLEISFEKAGTATVVRFYLSPL